MGIFVVGQEKQVYKELQLLKQTVILFMYNKESQLFINLTDISIKTFYYISFPHLFP